MRRPGAEFPACAPGLRAQIRAFLAEQRRAGTYVPGVNTWLGGLDPEFSAALGRRGWIGMTWPAEYGGGARPALERFVVIEELLAAGAPIAAHWFADRQVGPALLRYGTEEQRRALLPVMAAGRCFFAIGMSEPDTGSDLASVSTRASRADGGWRVSGTKLWSSGAHICHFMMTLLRTGPGRHEGLSQMMIDLASPGISIRPIRYLTGESHFNEVVLDDVFVPDSRVLGRVGAGWEQVNSELAYERSGPERFLSVMQLLERFFRLVRDDPQPRLVSTLGSVFAQLWTLRELSVRIALALDGGAAPETEAALIKDLGTRFEQDCVTLIRMVAAGTRTGDGFAEMLWNATLQSPAFTLRGGTTEVLRILIARELGR